MNYRTPTPPPLFAPTEDLPRLAGQNREVLRRLQAGERLTPIDAEAFGCHRLAARCHDIREAGYPVKSKRQGKCCVYWIERSDNGEA